MKIKYFNGHMKTKKRLNQNLIGLGGLLTVPILSFGQISVPQRPNIVIIVADDLGYGDLSCYGSTALQTPGMDRLALEGLRFTQGHCTAATSTPSRYSLLTGMYPWSNPDAKILPGNAALIIGTDQLTLPKVMKRAGYVTGTVGKWHLGLGDSQVDWNDRIYPGAGEVGYDYSFIQAATNDRVPCIFIENGMGVGLEKDDPIYVSYRKNFEGEPTGKDNPELLRMHPSVGHAGSIVNGVPRIGFQTGGRKAQWRDEEMAELFLGKAKDFIRANKNQPFFLYYGLHQPHVPRVPNERFVGKSGMGPRGDVILEADWCVSEFLKEMDRLAEGLHQGIILYVRDYQYYILSDVLSDSTSFIVILDHIEDPHNFGAIVRTCEAAGVDAIIIPKDRQVQVNATVMKTSVGTLNQVKIVQVANLASTIDYLKEHDFWVVGTALEDSLDYRKIDYSGKTVLIVGNEGVGMSKLVRKKCDFIAKIPMYGTTNSLNASVASGIMIYEVIRNRK